MIRAVSRLLGGLSVIAVVAAVLLLGVLLVPPRPDVEHVNPRPHQGRFHDPDGCEYCKLADQGRRPHTAEEAEVLEKAFQERAAAVKRAIAEGRTP